MFQNPCIFTEYIHWNIFYKSQDLKYPVVFKISTRKIMWKPRTHVKLKMTNVMQPHTITKRSPWRYENKGLACSTSGGIVFSKNSGLSHIEGFMDKKCSFLGPISFSSCVLIVLCPVCELSLAIVKLLLPESDSHCRPLATFPLGNTSWDLKNAQGDIMSISSQWWPHIGWLQETQALLFLNASHCWGYYASAHVWNWER